MWRDDCIPMRRGHAMCKVHLCYLHTQTDTQIDKYDLKSLTLTLRTVTNSLPFGIAAMQLLVL